MPKRSAAITEARIRQIIYEELVAQHLINEGIWDDVASGAKRLSAYVTKQFKSVAAGWAKAISERLGKLKEVPDDVKTVFGALKQAMQETGETFKMDETLKQAKELGELGKNALAIVEKDLEGPVHEKAKAAGTQAEGKYLPAAYAVLAERSYLTSSQKRLNEDFGVTTVMGLGLAVMGGLPMLFKGLHKLAGVLGAEGAAHMFEKAEHVTHAVEQKVVDFVVPDKLSYALYKILQKKGIKLSKGDEALTFEQFQIDADKSGAMKKAQGLIYKTLLIYFALQGLAGVLHAGASLLGFVEGAATSVKGVELAKGAQEIAKLVRAGAAGAAV